LNFFSQNKNTIISTLLGVLILLVLSSIQKLSMGVNPLLLKNLFMPIFIGASIGCLVGILLNKNNVLLSQLKSTNTVLEQQVKDRTIELIEKNNELKKLSNTDALTNISNRRHLDLFLYRECKRLSRTHATLSVILCDIDHFKQYNDNYGHQAGDDCLKQVAQLIHSHLCRATDFVARYGGEEFMIVLPDTNLEAATCIAEKIRLSIEKMNIKNPDDTTSSVTMSFGIAIASSQSAEIKESALIGKADKALYAAKNNGRNRIHSEET